MFEIGDVVLLPPEFGSEKKGVLVRQEPNEIWLVQIGTSGYAFLPEKDLRTLTRVKKCEHCNAQLNTHSPVCCVNPENIFKCLTCGTCDCKKQKEKTQ